MKWYCTVAAVLVAATMGLAGCATQPEGTKTAEAKDGCLGVAPPTGSLVRRKEDCGAAKQDDQAKQLMIDQIRAQPGLGGTVMKPGG
ncbi:MAG TPA: hypothetical protein VMZ74_16225 [Ramlibacter sp.]|nr:hypothetical protein [Ramlibacter sp.]